MKVLALIILIIGSTLPLSAQTQLPKSSSTDNLIITLKDIKTKAAHIQASKQTSSDLNNTRHFFQSNRVIKTQGKVFLSGGGNYTFTAGDSIVLEPGFEVDSNLEFTAEIKQVQEEASTAVILNSDLGNNKILEVSAEKNGSLKAFTLFPNPASEQFYIEYEVTQTAQVSIALYTQDGTPIQSFIAPQQQEPGSYKLTLPVRNIPNGLYLVSLKINNLTISQRIILQ